MSANYLEQIKFRSIGSLTVNELKQWLTEELTNYSLAQGYVPSEDDKVFLFTIAQFQSLVLKKYKNWAVDEIHRVLMLSLSGFYGKNYGKPNYSQLAKIMYLAGNSRAEVYAKRAELDNQSAKNDRAPLESLSIGWDFIRWTKANNVDPEAVKFVDYEKARLSNRLTEFTNQYKNSL